MAATYLPVSVKTAHWISELLDNKRRARGRVGAGRGPGRVGRTARRPRPPGCGHRRQSSWMASSTALASASCHRWRSCTRVTGPVWPPRHRPATSCRERRARSRAGGRSGPGRGRGAEHKRVRPCHESGRLGRLTPWGHACGGSRAVIGCSATPRASPPANRDSSAAASARIGAMLVLKPPKLPIPTRRKIEAHLEEGGIIAD